MRLLCMSFDGDFIIERPYFATTEQLWDYANDIGSKWYFYPFMFGVTDTGTTIRATTSQFELARDKRVATIRQMFATLSKEAKPDEDVDAYSWRVRSELTRRYDSAAFDDDLALRHRVAKLRRKHSTKETDHDNRRLRASAARCS